MKLKTVIDESGTVTTDHVKLIIEAQRLEIAVDTKSLAASLAIIGATEIVNALINTTKKASKSTIKQRLARGITDDRLFHATGRLQRDIAAVRVSDSVYDVMAPPGYFEDPDVFQKFSDEVLERAFKTGGPIDLAVDGQLDKIGKEVAKVER